MHRVVVLDLPSSEAILFPFKKDEEDTNKEESALTGSQVLASYTCTLSYI